MLPKTFSPNEKSKFDEKAGVKLDKPPKFKIELCGVVEDEKAIKNTTKRVRILKI